MKRTLIQNAVIVNEGRKVLGSVVIENEKIAEILVGEEKATAPCDDGSSLARKLRWRSKASVYQGNSLSVK